MAKKPSKKAPLATKQNPPNDSISEDESDVSPIKPKPKAKASVDLGIENAVAGGSKPKKSASEMYQKVLATVVEADLSSLNWNTF